MPAAITGATPFSVLFGRSSPRDEYVADRPVKPQDLAATVYHHLGIDAARVSFKDGLGRPLYLLKGDRPANCWREARRAWAWAWPTISPLSGHVT